MIYVWWHLTSKDKYTYITHHLPFEDRSNEAKLRATKPRNKPDTNTRHKPDTNQTKTRHKPDTNQTKFLKSQHPSTFPIENSLHRKLLRMLPEPAAGGALSTKKKRKKKSVS